MIVMPARVDAADRSRPARRIRPRSARRRSRRAAAAAARWPARAPARAACARAGSARRPSRLAWPASPVSSQDRGAARRPTSRSRLRRPKAAATSRFSNTVSRSNGCGIWKRAADARAAARSGGARVMSLPSKRMRPAFGRRLPVIRLNSVVLPAPFGPMMPSASPRATEGDARRRPSARRSDFETFSSARISCLPCPCSPSDGRRRSPPADQAQAIGSILPAAGFRAPSCCRR